MYGENIGERVCLEKTLKIEGGYVLRKYLREGIFGENI